MSNINFINYIVMLLISTLNFGQSTSENPEPKSIHTWLDSDKSDIYSYDIDVKVVYFPGLTQQNWLYYFSLQVNFTDHEEWSHGGIQLANVVEFKDSGNRGINWGGGSDWAGYGGIGRTNTPFIWKVGNWYRYRVWRLEKDEEGYWQWGFWVMDYNTGQDNFYGTVRTKSSYINNAAVWIETGYGVSCDTDPVKIEWRNPNFNSLSGTKQVPNKGTASYNGTCDGDFSTNQEMISTSPLKWFQTTKSKRVTAHYAKMW